MSDSSVSLDKSAGGSAPRRGRRPARYEVPKVPVARTIQYATLALGAMVLTMVLRSIDLAFHDSTLQKYVTDVNNDADKPVKNFDAAQQVHALRIGTLISAIVICVATLLIMGAMRSPRSASASRWALLIILVLTSTPFTIIPIKGFPIVAQTAGVLGGIASIAAIVLIFLPTSTAYFRACREAAMPPELRGQPRPSLFRPRAGSSRIVAPAARTGARPAAASSASSSKAKAKVRSDAEAVAKGAELARSRAKTSKRRPE